MKKVLELDTGMAIEHFSNRKVEKLIKKGKTFIIEIPALLTRESLTITVKVKKNHLKMKAHCTGILESHGDQNTVYTCEKNAQKLREKLWYLLTEMYT